MTDSIAELIKQKNKLLEANDRLHHSIEQAIKYLDETQEEEMTIKNWDAVCNAYSWLEEALEKNDD